MIGVMKRTVLLVSLALLVLPGCRSSSSKKHQPVGEREQQAGAKQEPATVAKDDPAAAKAASQATQLLESSKLRFRSLGSDCQAIAFDEVDEKTTLGEVANYYKSKAQRKDSKCRKSGQGFDCDVEYANNASEDTEFFVRVSFQLTPGAELVTSSVTCLLAG